MKSVNLQYNKLGCLDDGTNESSTKSLMFFWYLFILFYRLSALKTLYFYFCNFIKKINWKDICKEFCKKSWEKNNTWNIRRLVDDSFVPSSKQPSVLCCRLMDFSNCRKIVRTIIYAFKKLGRNIQIITCLVFVRKQHLYFA